MEIKKKKKHNVDHMNKPYLLFLPHLYYDNTTHKTPTELISRFEVKPFEMLHKPFIGLVIPIYKLTQNASFINVYKDVKVIYKISLRFLLVLQFITESNHYIYIIIPVSSIVFTY